MNANDVFFLIFRTFENIECFPAPKLNLVIGPNGTGKSSLVCAIVLGLGGKPKLIGRAHTVRIKNNFVLY